jgi:hypothetical protein
MRDPQNDDRMIIELLAFIKHTNSHIEFIDIGIIENAKIKSSTNTSQFPFYIVNQILKQCNYKYYVIFHEIYTHSVISYHDSIQKLFKQYPVIIPEHTQNLNKYSDIYISNKLLDVTNKSIDLAFLKYISRNFHDLSIKYPFIAFNIDTFYELSAFSYCFPYYFSIIDFLLKAESGVIETFQFKLPKIHNASKAIHDTNINASLYLDELNQLYNRWGYLS